ncbi:ribonuclease [Puteibacter caeruleilacunae]|nr:ribonuclease [Puteibacter caeruleilacunae]
MRILIIILLVVVCSNVAWADYLEVRRSANVKAEPTSNGEVVYKAKPGELVILLNEDKQFNGYYHIRRKTGLEGYIYRTLVRRHKGQIPGDSNTSNSVAAQIYGVGQVPQDYYDGTEKLKGEMLKRKLHTIIKGHKVFSYNDLWEILPETDQDPNNKDNVILLYTGRSQKAFNRDRGTKFDYAAHGYSLVDSWNREHVWAKSHGFPDKKDTAYTDIHHLRPADRSVNSARNTRSFDFAQEQYFDNGNKVETDCHKGDNWTWEPPDNVKGDVARMIFYMAVRYEGPNMDLEIVDATPPKGTKDKIHGRLSTLLKWHNEDPVDNWERRRNDIIFKDYQGNRNPFIDHPELVYLIWGNN